MRMTGLLREVGVACYLTKIILIFMKRLNRSLKKDFF